jgi:dATP pyrophosphohydrolase
VSEHATPRLACAAANSKAYKIPVSVLVLIHTPDKQVLLLERADRPGCWQSVTGSQEVGEALAETAIREVSEETGLDAKAHGLADWQRSVEFEIYPEWRQRYEPGVTRNTEHWFGLCVPEPLPVRLDPKEHLAWQWLPWEQAAVKVFSWTNAEAIRLLSEK